MGYESGVGRLVEPLTGKALEAATTTSRVVARAAHYRQEGLERGDRVFLHFGNCAEFFVELLAIWRAGGCVVPLDPSLTPFEIETLARHARPRISVWHGGVDERVHQALDRLGVELVELTELDGGASAAGEDDASGLHLDEDALILFTSGTTGDPKGVVHTHRSLAARWASLRDHLGLDAFRRTLCLLPTHFGHGLICNALYPWLSGCDLHVQPPFRPDTLSDLGAVVDEHRITFLSSVPAVWRLALRIAEPPARGTLERVVVGSAPLSASLWQSIRGWSGTSDVLNAYGITETASWLAGTTVSDFTPEDGLVGYAWGGTILVTRSSEPAARVSGQSVCAPGEPGYIWVQTPALMRGYLGRDDLTRKVVHDGWFLTGDLGVVDDRGALYLRGRERDEINKGGMKVHPADVDAVIERFPQTTDVCTFAFEEPFLGEDVGVAVSLASSEPATVLAVREWAALHLTKHQLPQRWYVLPEIPRTSRGKVNRATVADVCAAESPVNFVALQRVTS